MSILRIVSTLLSLKEKRGSGSEDKSDRTMEKNAEEVGKIIDHVMSLGLQKMLGMVGQRGPTPP